MKTISLIASGENVLDHCVKTFAAMNYSNLDVDPNEGKISGERRSYFFGTRYSFNLFVRKVNDFVTSMELTVNPHHPVPTLSDQEKEIRMAAQLENLFSKLEAREYFYYGI